MVFLSVKSFDRKHLSFSPPFRFWLANCALVNNCLCKVIQLLLLIQLLWPTRPQKHRPLVLPLLAGGSRAELSACVVHNLSGFRGVFRHSYMWHRIKHKFATAVR